MKQTRLNTVPAHHVTEKDRDRLGEIDTALLTILKDNLWHDRGELTVGLRGAVVHSAAARLRKHGYRIECRRGDKAGATEYRLRDVI